MMIILDVCKGLNLYQLQSTFFNIEVPSHTEAQICFYTSEGTINVSTFLEKKVSLLIAPENHTLLNLRTPFFPHPKSLLFL